MKKFVSDAGSVFNRAVQFTEEKIGSAERTELEPQLVAALQRADKTQKWTEQILHQTEAVLQPNPNVRMEDSVYDILAKKKKDRLTNTEELGQYMIEAGNEFGPGTPYGNALIYVGQTEQKVGESEREYVQAAANCFLQPLKTFLEGDLKTLQKERNTLETKRLDLDACKTKVKRAKAGPAKTEGTDAVDKAEVEQQKAQAEFDRQAEITKLLLEGITSTHAHHLRCLHDFVEVQSNYFARCHQYMTDLQRQLGSKPEATGQKEFTG